MCGCEFHAKNIDSIHCSRKCTNTAYNRKRRQKKAEERLRTISSEAEGKEFLKVSEAVAVFGVTKAKIYRLIACGALDIVGCERPHLLKRLQLEAMFSKREHVIEMMHRQPKKLYSLEPDDCYTIGEVAEKYKASAKMVYEAIRHFSVPMRQIGQQVYVPKTDIDLIFS